MKKFSLIALILALTSTVFAEEISALMKEFQRRDAIVLSRDEVKVVRFLRSHKVNEKQLKSIEFIDGDATGRWLVDTGNGDICIGNISEDLLKCKNEMGLTTLHYVGDSD